ncbi:MAG TPA: hypothetical protein VGM34_03680 [Chlamydiales bacterium]
MALPIGIGACYGAVAAISINIVALVALYKRQDFFKLDLEDACSRKDVEKTRSLFKTTPISFHQSHLIAFKELMALSEKKPTLNLDFIIEHAASQIQGRTDIREADLSLRVICSLLIRQKTLWATQVFSRILTDRHHLLFGEDTIIYILAWIEHATNEGNLEVFDLLASDIKNNFASYLQLAKEEHILPLLQFLLPQDRFKAVLDKGFLAQAMPKIKTNAKALEYVENCAQFVKLVEDKRVSELPKNQRYCGSANLAEKAEADAQQRLQGSISSLLQKLKPTPFWISNSIFFILTQKLKDEQPIIKQLFDYWKQLPEKNMMLVEEIGMSLNHTVFPMLLSSFQIRPEKLNEYLTLAVKRESVAVEFLLHAEYLGKKEHLPKIQKALIDAADDYTTADILRALEGLQSPQEIVSFVISNQLSCKWKGFSLQAYKKIAAEAQTAKPI